MSLISKKFADELAEKQMRDAYLAAQTRTKIVAQIRTIRSQREWSQGEFARRLGKPQSNVSQRLENREYGGFTLGTLLEVAAAFDVGLVVEFVPYEDFIRRTSDLTRRALQVSSFNPAALTALCQDESTSTSGIGNALAVLNQGMIEQFLVGPGADWYTQSFSGVAPTMLPLNTFLSGSFYMTPPHPGVGLFPQSPPVSPYLLAVKDQEIARLEQRLAITEERLAEVNEENRRLRRSVDTPNPLSGDFFDNLVRSGPGFGFHRANITDQSGGPV